MDPYFKVEVLSQTPQPQRTIYAAMHQDYAEGFVWDERDRFPDEPKAGEVVIRNLLAGNRGHFGPIEHPQIVLNCGWFPHSVMQQARTHRVSVSFDVQSGRYTGQRILDVVDGRRELEEVFYLRPVGFYTDRQGAKYEYTATARQADRDWCEKLAQHYAQKIRVEGYAEEHARDLIPYAIRQHFVVSFNCRSLMHFLDLRAKNDAQLEIIQLCELIWPHFEAWAPAIAEWYHKNRWGKARLSP
ncbi:FAD-dependent thymidylate synthase [Alkalinema pantanalense CENA528]|uniref:FAD-dependent thymidylate synthase n=1 Tax=Alkalinema pantanalense TaxID=1620705 RepID=UPI003D6E90AC